MYSTASASNEIVDEDTYIYYQEPTPADELVASEILPDLCKSSIEYAISTMGNEAYTHGMRMAVGLTALKHLLCLVEKNCTFPTPAELGMEPVPYTRKYLSWIPEHDRQPCCGTILLPPHTNKLINDKPPKDLKTFAVTTK